MNPLPKNLLTEQVDDKFGMSGSSSEESDVFDPELVLAQSLADPDLTQHMTRGCRDGCDAIVAYYRCRFEIGQQRYVLHIPFSPPFDGMPDVEASVWECADARVRVTDRQKFGTRLEIVFPQPLNQPANLLVEAMINYKQPETKASDE